MADDYLQALKCIQDVPNRLEMSTCVYFLVLFFIASDTIEWQKQAFLSQQEAGRPVISATDHIFYGFTAVTNPRGMLGNHLKTYKSLVSKIVIYKLFLYSPNIPHGFVYAGKPLENTVFCFHKTIIIVNGSNILRVYRNNKP